MGMIFSPIYTLEPSLLLYGLCGTDTSIDTVGYGFWIPEMDLHKMGLRNEIFSYYDKKGELKNIRNIEWCHEFRREYLQS